MSANRMAVERTELLLQFGEALRVELTELEIEIGLRALMEFDMDEVRRAVTEIILGDQKLEFGQSVVGLLVSRARQMRFAEFAMRVKPPETPQIERDKPEPNISMSEFLAKYPDSPLRQFSKAFRDSFRAENPALSDDQLAQKRRAQMRALEEHEQKAGPIVDKRKPDPIEEVI